MIIGDDLLSKKTLITTEDIDQFVDLTGDHFYAHVKTTNFTGTMFEQQVAHGISSSVLPPVYVKIAMKRTKCG